MKLSIIIRCYNRLEYTVRSIVSIDENCGLAKKDYEIICIDQGSDDGTDLWLDHMDREGYYPIVPVYLKTNINDGEGMQRGIDAAKGEWIAQHDNDITLITKGYYKYLIDIYKSLENMRIKVCAIGGSHKQGPNKTSAPWKFGIKRHINKKDSIFKVAHDGIPYYTMELGGARLFLSPISWVTASFIFRKEFTSLPFNKGMCNSFCGSWFDKGYENIICENLKFWHIDSSDEGGEYVQKQYEKHPSYSYIKRHYRKFIKEK